MNQRKTANQTVKDRLFSALVQFAVLRDWSKLTVTELIKTSGVARASFYRNFSSVEELIDYGIERMALRYREGKPADNGEVHGREMLLYKFRFYRDYAGLVLAFHHARMATTLLDVITDCEIDACGDMPAGSIERYKLYFFSGAFYNVLLCWLEGGMRETPEAMADAFLGLIGGGL